MKNFFFVMAVVAMAWTSKPAVAQFNFGVKSGVNLSTLSTNQPEETLVGGRIGVTAEYYLPSSIGFRTGLFYSQKGSAYIEGWFTRVEKDYLTPPNKGEALFMKARLNYLDIPLEARYKFTLDEKTRITLGLGGYVGYALNGKTIARYENDGVIHNAFKEMKTPAGHIVKPFERMDYGLTLGVEFVYRHFVVETNYQFGVRNLNKTLPVGALDASRNSTITISFGYNFR